MDQALHMHMVPAADVAALRKFYVDGLGWSTWGPPMPGSLMLRAGTATIVFLNRDYLAAESGIDVSAAPRAINAVFVAEKADVDAQIAGAVAAGATLTSPIRDPRWRALLGLFHRPRRQRLGNRLEPGDATRRRRRPRPQTPLIKPAGRTR